MTQGPTPTQKTITVEQGTAEWAFLAALRALKALAEAGADQSSVHLYVDGSGELRVPARQVGILHNKDFDLSGLTGSTRRDLLEEHDLVISQCYGFASRDWP